MAKDHRQELRDLVERMENMDPDKVQDGVYRSFTFQLCPACQKEYLKDPLLREERGKQ